MGGLEATEKLYFYRWSLQISDLAIFVCSNNQPGTRKSKSQPWGADKIESL